MRISDWSSDVCSSGLCDLAQAEPARGHADEAERERDNRDDLSARTFEERGELRERGIEGRVGAGESRTSKHDERKECCRRQKRQVFLAEQDRKSTRLNSSH